MIISFIISQRQNTIHLWINYSKWVNLSAWRRPQWEVWHQRLITQQHCTDLIDLIIDFIIYHVGGTDQSVIFLLSTIAWKSSQKEGAWISPSPDTCTHSSCEFQKSYLYILWFFFSWNIYQIWSTLISVSWGCAVQIESIILLVSIKNLTTHKLIFFSPKTYSYNFQYG